jgi:hypothetical protein
MTAICRIYLQPNHAPPKLDYIIQDDYMIVQVPPNTPIFDTTDLCQYPCCRQHVATGMHSQKRLHYCDEHSQYARRMQKINYRRQSEKIKTGLCARRDCTNRRAPNKKKLGTMGRCCTEHARQSNERAKLSYQRRKIKRLGLP